MAIRGSYVSEEDIDAELFGEPNRGTLDYLRERVERHADRAREVFGGFFRDARETFERYNGDAALRRIRARVRETVDIYERDVIRPLRSIENIQRAKPIMQRYIMANTVVRLLHENQEIDGYSDSYRNPRPDLRGFRDPDYMRVIDGILFDEDRHGVVVSDDPEGAWVAYQDIFDHGEERDLDVIEQADVLSTWDIIEAHLRAKKKDPTSVLNENM